MGIRSTSMAGLRLAALFVIVAVVTCNVEDSTASYRLDDSMSAVMPLNEFVDMGEAVDPAAANSAANAAESEAATATDKAKNAANSAEAAERDAQDKVNQADSQANADQTKISDAKTEEDKLKAAKRKSEQDEALAKKDEADAAKTGAKVAAEVKLTDAEKQELAGARAKKGGLRSAMDSATLAYKKNEHRIRQLTGAVDKNMSLEAHEKQQREAAAHKADESQQLADRAQEAKKRAEDELSRAKAKEDKAKADLDKEQKALQETEAASAKAQAELKIALANGTASKEMIAEAARLKAKVATQLDATNRAKDKLVAAESETKQKASESKKASDKAGALDRL